MGAQEIFRTPSVSIIYFWYFDLSTRNEQDIKKRNYKIDKWFISIKDEDDICGIVANKGITESVTPNYFFEEDYLEDIRAVYLVMSPEYIENHFEDIRKSGNLISIFILFLVQ